MLPHILSGDKKMSKYERLWDYVKEQNREYLKLTYAEIEAFAGVPLDHSFLKSKRELLESGFVVEKISMKEKTVSFAKRQD